MMFDVFHGISLSVSKGEPVVSEDLRNCRSTLMKWNRI
jgi:hypothetical protein